CPHCLKDLPPGIADHCPSCGKNPWVKLVVAPPLGMAAPAAPFRSVSGMQHSIRYTQPVLPPDVNQFYLPAAGSKAGHELEYQPWVLGFAEVVFQFDKRTGLAHK